MKNFSDPKLMAMVLTQEGFMRWAEGQPMTKGDFKPQWAYLFKDFALSLLAGEAKGE